MIKLGAPVDIVAQEPGLVEKLADLTEGEPLLIRLYVEDLWNLSCEGATVTRADLEKLKPGFNSYFERWFTLQEKLWREEETGVQAGRNPKSLSSEELCPERGVDAGSEALSAEGAALSMAPRFSSSGAAKFPSLAGLGCQPCG